MLRFLAYLTLLLPTTNAFVTKTPLRSSRFRSLVTTHGLDARTPAGVAKLLDRTFIKVGMKREYIGVTLLTRRVVANQACLELPSGYVDAMKLFIAAAISGYENAMKVRAYCHQ